MKRSLRIVASVACLAACVAVLELRGRSRWWTDGLYGQLTPTQSLVVASNGGQMRFWMIPSASLNGFPRYGRFRKSIYGCTSQFDTAIFANSSPAAFHVPHVGLMACMATFAAVPWTGMRFSLRTLLGAMTAAAVVLAAMVMLK